MDKRYKIKRILRMEFRRWFRTYKERWDKLSRSIQAVNKDVENVSITTDKISKKFESINKVEFKDTKEIQSIEKLN